MKNNFFSLELFATSLYVFCLNFERTEFLPNFLLSKITIVILILVFLLRIKSSITYRPRILYNQFFYVLPILIIYFINIINNIIYFNSTFTEILNIPFLLNILILLIFTNIFIDKFEYFDVILNVFIFSTAIVSVFYLLEINVEYYQNRASVLSLNSNTVGLHCSICILLILNKFFKKGFSLLYSVLGFFLVILLFSSASRIAFVVIFLGLLYLIFINDNLKSWKKYLSIFFILMISPIFIYYFTDSLVFQRFLRTLAEGDLSSRDYVWSRILYTFANENILIGIGQNKYFDVAYNFNFASEDGISPHNVFIETFLYSGALGLIAFIFFIFKNLNKSYSILRKSKNLIPLFFITIVIGLSLSGQIYESKLPWVLMSYILSHSILTKYAVKN